MVKLISIHPVAVTLGPFFKNLSFPSAVLGEAAFIRQCIFDRVILLIINLGRLSIDH